MNLIDYARILIRRGWIMLLLGIIAAASAYLFSQSLSPTYRATQKVRIVPSRTDFGLVQSAKQMLNSHVAYLNSSSRAAEVIDRLQLDMLPQHLLADVSFASDLNSLVIQIDVEHGNPGQAQAIAAAWGDLLMQYRNEENQQARREDRINATAQDSPVISGQSPNVRINALVGLLAGIFVGGIIVFALEYLDSAVVRRREDVEGYAGLPVLAAVPPSD